MAKKKIPERDPKTTRKACPKELQLAARPRKRKGETVQLRKKEKTSKRPPLRRKGSR